MYTQKNLTYASSLTYIMYVRRMDFAKLETDLFGEDETGESWVMLKVALQNQDALLVVKGLVQIRSNSESLCDLAREKVIMIEENPELVKF